MSSSTSTPSDTLVFSQEMLDRSPESLPPRLPQASASPAAASSSSAAASNPHDPLGTGVFVNLDFNQRTRTIEFAPGTPTGILNLVFIPSALTNSPHVMCIGTSADVAAEVIALMKSQGDVTPADCVRIGQKHQTHPDSVRSIAQQFWSRRVRFNHPFTTVLSMYLTDPSKPLSDSVNAVRSVSFSYDKGLKQFPTIGLACEKLNVVADATKYVYCSHEGKAEIYVSEYADPVPEAQIDTFLQAWTTINKDIDWFKRLHPAIPGLSVKILSNICIAVVNRLNSGQDCSIHFQTKTVVVPAVRVCTPAVFLIIDAAKKIYAVDPTQHGKAPRCAFCTFRDGVVRCPHCKAQRTCSQACLAEDWTKKHRNECMGIVIAKPASSSSS